MQNPYSGFAIGGAQVVKSVRCVWRRVRFAIALGAASLSNAVDDAVQRPDDPDVPAPDPTADADAAEDKQPAFWYGGQAVIEGVMMRGRYVAAVSVRNPSGGIVTKEVPLNAALYRGRVAKLPFVRGLVLLWDALVLGTSALMWAADVAMEQEEDIDFSLEGAAGVGLVAFSLSLGIGLFFVLPAAASAAVKSVTGLDSKLAADVIEGLIKLAIFIGYIWAIGWMEDVKRLFGYHGAEHKTINAYEDDAELEPETVQRYPIEHPRCGTAFLLTLVMLSVLVHIVTGRPDSLPMLLLSRIGLIFPIAGIAYEIIRFTAKNLENPLVQVIVKPNLALQHLTTREPDLSMIEVGITSLERVLAAEQSGVAVPETRISEAVAPAPATAAVEPSAD